MYRISLLKCRIRNVLLRDGGRTRFFMMRSFILAFFCVCLVLLTVAIPIDRNIKVVADLQDVMDNLRRNRDVQHFEEGLKTGDATSRRGRVLQLSDYYDSQGKGEAKNVFMSRSGDVAASGRNKEYTLDVNGDNDTLWLDTPDLQDSSNNGQTSSSPIKRLPQAIIIGVKKGGTRALLEFLRIHPDVRAPGPEPHFFDRHYDKGLDWYREQMPSSLAGQITIEKTPCYFVTKEVPQRIFNMSKTIKLIVVVRDPVTRAISDYTQAATKRPGMKPFDQMAFIDNSSRIVDTKWAAVRIGVYAKHLERWLKYFSLSQIHFVNGEKLISDPAGEMAKVQEFLGLKRIVTDKHFYLKDSRGFPCLKKRPGSGRPHCLRNNKGRTHPHVDSHVLSRLRDFFRPFNLKFYQMTGMKFGWS